jgi:hypothetical protein
VYRELIQEHGHDPVGQPPSSGHPRVELPRGFAPRTVREVPARAWIEQALATSTWDLYDTWLQRAAAGGGLPAADPAERGQKPAPVERRRHRQP